MNALRALIRRMATAQAERTDLFDALLLGRQARYAFTRLRFFAPRLALRTALHAVEVGFLAQALPWDLFAPLLGYRAATALVSGLYWGLLEALRGRVRALYRAGHPQRAPRAIESWLAIAWLLAALAIACVLGVLWLGPRDPAWRGVTLFDAYGFACVLRLATDLVARTYQAGALAVRRIQRPFATLVVPDVFELGLVLVSWEVLGPWGFALSITLSGVLRAWLGIHYARRTYQGLRGGVPHLVPRRSPALTRTDLREALLHAAANGTAQLDALLLFALTQAARSGRGDMSFAALYYVLRPLLGAAQSWTRVFYFDWKQLEAGVGLLFHAAFRRMLARVSAAVSILVALCAAGLVAWFDDLPVPPAALALAPLFVARSLFALEQLEAFSLGRHRRLAGMAGVLVLSLAVLWFVHVRELGFIVGMTAVLLAVVAWAARSEPNTPEAQAQGSGLAPWAARLADHPGPVELGIAQVDARLTTPAKALLGLSRALSPWDVTRLGPRHLVWFRPGGESLTQSRARAVAGAGGTLKTLELSAHATGREARWAAPLVHQLDSQLGPTGERDDEATLLAAFRAAVPGGHVLDFARGTGSVAAARALPRPARHAVLSQLAGRARRARRARQYDVAVLYRRGVPRYAFVAPRGSPGFVPLALRVRRASLA